MNFFQRLVTSTIVALMAYPIHYHFYMRSSTMVHTMPRKCLPRGALRFPTAEDFLEYKHSTHRTSHSRDFILTIMPQYRFYVVPVMAKQMKFGELFVDCFHQGQEVGWNLIPLIQANGLIDDGDAYLQSCFLVVGLNRKRLATNSVGYLKWS
jgi:hypothetical protein